MLSPLRLKAGILQKFSLENFVEAKLVRASAERYPSLLYLLLRGTRKACSSPNDYSRQLCQWSLCFLFR